MKMIFVLEHNSRKKIFELTDASTIREVLTFELKICSKNITVLPSVISSSK